MNEFGIKNPKASVRDLGLTNVAAAYWNLPPAELVEETIIRGEGVLADTGALVIDTGEFTGRSPKDRYIVEDDITRESVWWGDINQPYSSEAFDVLYDKVLAYLTGKEVYVRDAYACADEAYRMNIRVLTEFPWQNLFASNLFLRPDREEILAFDPEWTVVAAPGYFADPAKDGTRNHNFAILNFTRKVILIGGTAYTGEIKKGIFSVLNFILPYQKKVLSMHCSANIGEKGDTAVFFGLSGTGKTTLSADPVRNLIGDDEHGWGDKGVFNFEGGCYAKCIDLTEEKEPQIYRAIKFGTLLENVEFYPETTTVDYTNVTKTQNTRAAYPIDFIDNIAEPSVGGIPKNIFFLTADAFGVLPPVSKLDPGQAMYHFISGYTAKVAGTEVGVTEPQATFSACFGAPFLPLHPTYYADMLGEKMKAHGVQVWLINTGWTGGNYGVGERIRLKYTRAMINAALEGKLDAVTYKAHPVFGLQVPQECPDVPDELLNPRDTWKDQSAYDKMAQELALKFNKNFEKYAANAKPEILAAAPKADVKVPITS
ncbi:MAG: phosphoenolpyruvate carboxykinase (ATP) [Flavobacteriales bacterium]|nr:phosphoenolpyruvate carboxykinase (ATP) [Flavobacteriales bacterium]MCB9448766.1 phosphoenolpyruvate carboxykinase (ATP) [Flavobacteriales bacterium]